VRPVLVKKSSLALSATYVAGMVLAVVGPMLLPANYYFDTATIRDYMETAETVAFNDSFNNTALLYRGLGFGVLFPHALAGPLSFTAVYLAVVSAAGMARAKWFPWLFALFAAWAVPLAIYDGTYSKEVIALLVAAAMVRLSGSGRGVAYAAAFGLAYAMLFRTYWGLVIVLWLTMLIVWRMGGGWAPRLFAAIAVIVPLSLAAHEFAGLWLSDGRTVVVEARGFAPDPATMFANPLPNTSPVTDLINTASGWLMLVLPIFLLSLGGIQHVAFGVFQLTNTVLFVATQRRSRYAGRTNLSKQWRFAAAATFCVAYTLVQGMFGPDFGSFAKHEINLLPMFFYMLVHAARNHAKRNVCFAHADADAQR
jgi:hypothetical protein